MDHPGDSISDWLSRLKNGEAAAAQKLWERYSAELIRIAKQRLGSYASGLSNADDLALSVFGSVFRGAVDGRFTNVVSRDELWWLLLGITKRKAIDYGRRETAFRRNGGVPHINYSLEELVGSAPSPEFAVMLQDEFARLLKRLPTDLLRKIAGLRIEGYSAAEIAQQLAISVRGVERKLRIIRNNWKADFCHVSE